MTVRNTPLTESIQPARGRQGHETHRTGDGPRRSIQPRAQKLHEQLAAQIAADIVSGRLPAGEPIPSETALVTSVDVSKTVVREALQLLALAGMLSIQHGKRTIVNPSAEWDILNATVQTAYCSEGLAWPMVQDLYAVRVLLEPQAARWMAGAAHDDARRQLRELVGQMEAAAAAGDERQFVDLDREFHTMVVRGAGNRVLQAVLNDIHEVISTSWAITTSAPEYNDRALQDHTRIAEAIERGDAEAAEVAMREHLNWAAEVDRQQTAASSRTTDG